MVRDMVRRLLSVFVFTSFIASVQNRRKFSHSFVAWETFIYKSEKCSLLTCNIVGNSFQIQLVKTVLFIPLQSVPLWTS